ncbi:hypothetical protein EV182_002041 [Spiromyces aspiralis]|uniref:Uncharacterized protein n=1 Tax=Spiromyces aspiralis TaxID=68401 RepID=A0ACC1HFT9_9FUNG|nr:hypothetical protein EV182_002041 [Spiromyces aspiralis]
MDCNYYGVRQVTEALLPLMKPKGRIINISSSVGRLKLFSPELQKQYSRSDLAVPELDRLQEMFVSGVRDDTYQTLGYPQQSYGVTKAGVTAYTKILARLHKDDPRNLFFAAVCPGWVQTDMNRGKGHLTVDQAVETPIYLALSDEGRIFANNGEFWSRKTVAIW